MPQNQLKIRNNWSCGLQPPNRPHFHFIATYSLPASNPKLRGRDRDRRKRRETLTGIQPKRAGFEARQASEVAASIRSGRRRSPRQ